MIPNKKRNNRKSFNGQIALYDWEREKISISYYKDFLNNN
jgi:hypothetical protein